MFRHLWGNRPGRAVLSAVRAVLAATALTACVRVATHEAERAGRPALRQPAGRGRQRHLRGPGVDSSVPDFAGSGFAKAATPAPLAASVPSQAYGSFSVEDSEGRTAPPSTSAGHAVRGLTGPAGPRSTSCAGREPSDFGGIRIGSDHRAA